MRDPKSYYQASLKWGAVLGLLGFGWPGSASWLANAWYFGWAAAMGAMWWTLRGLRDSGVTEDANRALARNLLICLSLLSTGLWCVSVALIGLSRSWSIAPPAHEILLMAIPIGLYFPIAMAALALSAVLYHEPGDWRFRGFRSSTFFSSTIPFCWILYESRYL